MRNTDKNTKVSENARESRGVELRGHQSREARERPPIVYGHTSKFNLPPHINARAKDSGKILGWVAAWGGNEALEENYEDSLSRGWEMADEASYPELCRHYEKSPYGQRERTPGIRKGGEILMEMDLAVHEGWNNFYDSENEYNKLVLEMSREKTKNSSDTIIYENENRNSRSRPVR